MTTCFNPDSTEKSTCTVLLYTIDNRVSGNQHCGTTEISCDTQTAKKIQDIVSLYFQVSDPWGKKLFSSLFLDIKKLGYDWFEITPADKPDTTLAIKIIGDRNVFTEETSESYETIQKPGKLFVSMASPFGVQEYELDAAQIKTWTQEEEGQDNSLVAFFNSEAFQELAEGSTNLIFSRSLRKIELN